jgi:beta-lactamase regulating signal transducer with metallopeptidase domain
VIDALALYLMPLLVWLWRTTWQTSILIALILLIQKVAGRRLGARGSYGLWLVVLIRLAMPWTPPSGVSVHNLLPAPSLQEYKMHMASLRASLSPARTRGSSTGEASVAAHEAANDPASTTATPRERWPESGRLEGQTVVLLSLVWLTGVCFLLTYVAAGALRWRRVVRRGRTVTDRRILELLEDCRRLAGTRTEVGLTATDEVDSPALFGLLRPRLLLPRATLTARDRTELRHIFLHELAHLKRHDLLIGHLASLLHIFHWFNPLIGLAFRRMRADRELACDALALSLLRPSEACAYGRTIVHQIEQLLTARPRWLLAGMGGDRAQIQRRIAMIATAPQETYRHSPLALVLVAVLACTGLTDGFASGATWDDYARRDRPTTHQDRHANIQRTCIRNLDTGKYLVVRGDRVACDADEPGLAGLWEFRFDEVSNTARSDVYFYSVAARRYLTSDPQGNLAVNAREPNEAARWGTWPRPEGVWVISHYFKDGYLRLDEQGYVSAESFGRDARGYWDIHSVWRIKTSDDPKSNPQWQREHIPGPD